MHWQVALWSVFSLALAFAALSALRAAISADLIAPPTGLPVQALAIVVPLALVVAVMTWANMTKNYVEGYGGMVTVVRNAAMSSGFLILFLSYLLPIAVSTAIHGARAAGALLMSIGLLVSRMKLRRWITEPAVPVSAPQPRLGDEVPRPGQPQRGNGPQLGAPGSPLLSPETQPEDWNASLWDPEIQADIERRRRTEPTP